MAWRARLAETTRSLERFTHGVCLNATVGKGILPLPFFVIPQIIFDGSFNDNDERLTYFND
ncbi:MAG: hypothetical protein JWL90_3101 [Chthoniobacteraceae bacterium]|nr:hypothetical protein [Chthoniobacteraceae bacterium]